MFAADIPASIQSLLRNSQSTSPSFPTRHGSGGSEQGVGGKGAQEVRQFLIILIIIIKLILLKIRVKNVKLQIYEWQRATASDILTKRATASGAFGCYKYHTQFSQTQTLNSHKHK
jgi:hypothetical protein